MAKKMTLGNLRTEDKQKHTKRRILVGDYEVYIEENFKPTVIQLLSKELVEKIKYIEENGYEMAVSDYLFILIIKHFTDIKIPPTFESQVEMLRLLIDNELLNPIMESFKEEDLQKVHDTLHKGADNLNTLRLQVEQLQFDETMAQEGIEIETKDE